VATNKYFNLYNQKQEQSLVQSLVEEAVKIHGIDAIYIPRKQKKLDLIFNEDVLKHFDDFYPIEVYIKNVQAFEGDQDIFSKFGLDIKNQITFSVSRSSFNKILGRDFVRPREGDLIYLQMSTATAIYEITFVKEDAVFFNLGEFYIYDLQCEQFTFANEDVKTGIEEIDDIASRAESLLSIKLGTGAGTFSVGEVVYQGESVLGADAKATIVEIMDAKTIKVKDMFGEFTFDRGPLKGRNAQYTLLVDTDGANIENDISGSNNTLKENADSIIDFTEHNPFSEEDF